MAKIRVTIGFNTTSYGWSETYYRNSTVADTVEPTLVLASLRSGFLCGPEVQIVFIRISDDAVQRDAFQIRPRLIDKPKINCRDVTAAPPWNCRLIRCLNGANVVRFIEVSTIPKESLGPNQTPLIVGQFDDAIDVFRNELLKGWCIDSVTGGVNPEKPIDQYTQADGIVTVTCPGHGFTDGQLIRIVKGKGPGRPAGQFRVTAITANTFKLIGIFQPFLYFGGSKAKNVSKGLVPIEATSNYKNSHRDRGRPFALQAGRAKARK